MTSVLVAAAGSLGAGARLLLGEWVTRRAATELPWGTAVVNLIGSGALGFAVGVGASGDALVVASGFLAGFTTYSTWMVESVALVGEGHGGPVRAAVDWIGLFAGGVAVALLGWWIGGLVG